MITVYREFHKRVSEINLYTELLIDLVEKDSLLLINSKIVNKKVEKTKRLSYYKIVDLELKKILKANMFLLLYNLCESSIRQAMTEIYDTITSKNLNFKKVRNEIREIWLKSKYKNFKDKGSKDILSIIESIYDDNINIIYDHDKDISGNISPEVIKTLSEKIGFSLKMHYKLKRGDKVFTVKNKRNALAHGNVSFTECGKDYTVSDLLKIKKQVINYLNIVLYNIENYLNKKEFKKSKTTS